MPAFTGDKLVKMIKDNAKTKFDETVEIAMNLGIDTRHADQQVRGVVQLPHGTGKALRVAVFAKDDKAEEAKAAGADGERRAIARQTAAWLEGEIRKLPLVQREVLVLACIESLPQKDVAGILGLPLNTVKTHLRRARLALVSRLAQRNAIQHGEVPS